MSKKNVLASIKVENPCSEKWEDMQGNETVRFCSHCSKSVNNISELTRKEAVRLVRRSKGRLCIHYKRQPETNAPIFAERLYQLSRRTPVMAAGVVAASLALSTATYAQTTSPQLPTVQIESSTKTDSETSSISGYVTDPNGAVLPFALVSLINDQTGAFKTTTASNEGFYEFKEVAGGSYKLKIEAGGFESKEIVNVWLGDGREIRRDAQLSLQQVTEVVQVNSNRDSESTVVGIMIAMTESRNPLIQAVLSEDLDEVKARVMMRAKINVKDKAYDGITPLHAAVDTGNIEIVQFLLSSGAKTNIRDYQKRTPLMMMDYDAKPELIELMLRYGAKTNVVDKTKNTILHHIAEYDNADSVRLLIAYGISPNAVNYEGQTALMIAADNGQIETVKALLEAGADARIADKTGKTAWDMAENIEIKKLLESYGAVTGVSDKSVDQPDNK